MRKKSNKVGNTPKETGVFQTIAAYNDRYEAAYVIGVYNSLGEARSHYTKDMDSVKGQGYKHYAIRQVEGDGV